MSIIHDFVESLPNQALVSVTDGALDATWGGHACSPEIEDFKSRRIRRLRDWRRCTMI